MKITDLDGKVIEVDDLTLAIMQADDYRHYRHSCEGFELMDERQRTYWEDIYQKLLALRATDANP